MVDHGLLSPEMVLAECGAVLTGDHFIYKSGKHGSAYVNKDEVILRPEALRVIGVHMARMILDFGLKPDVVVGPAEAGIAVAQAVAAGMHDELHDIVWGWASKKGDFFELRNTIKKMVKGAQVLVVEDVTTTGSSIANVLPCVREAGGEVCAVAIMVDRGGITAEQLDVPVVLPLLEVPLEAHEPLECPLCKQGVPINTKLGRGEQYVLEHGQPAGE